MEQGRRVKMDMFYRKKLGEAALRNLFEQSRTTDEYKIFKYLGEECPRQRKRHNVDTTAGMSLVYKEQEA